MECGALAVRMAVVLVPTRAEVILLAIHIQVMMALSPSLIRSRPRSQKQNLGLTQAACKPGPFRLVSQRFSSNAMVRALVR
jgi:hypothetical protein